MAEPLERAMVFLTGLLAEGTMAAVEVRKIAEDSGYAWTTVRRAKAALGLAVTKDGRSANGANGRSYWALGSPEEFNMTPQKMAQLIDGQSSIARKVLEAVPKQEAWEPHMINGALKLMTRSTVDIKVLIACLHSLRRAGIIKESPANHFQRVHVNSDTTTNTNTAKVKEEKTMPPASAPASAPKKTTVLDEMARLADDVRTLGRDLTAKIKDIERRIEELALAADAEREEAARGNEKLQQLQALLRSLQE